LIMNISQIFPEEDSAIWNEDPGHRRLELTHLDQVSLIHGPKLASQYSAQDEYGVGFQPEAHILEPTTPLKRSSLKGRIATPKAIPDAIRSKITLLGVDTPPAKSLDLKNPGKAPQNLTIASSRKIDSRPAKGALATVEPPDKSIEQNNNVREEQNNNALLATSVVMDKTAFVRRNGQYFTRKALMIAGIKYEKSARVSADIVQDFSHRTSKKSTGGRQSIKEPGRRASMTADVKEPLLAKDRSLQRLMASSFLVSGKPDTHIVSKMRIKFAGKQYSPGNHIPSSTARAWANKVIQDILDSGQALPVDEADWDVELARLDSSNHNQNNNNNSNNNNSGKGAKDLGDGGGDKRAGGAKEPAGGGKDPGDDGDDDGDDDPSISESLTTESTKSGCSDPDNRGKSMPSPFERHRERWCLRAHMIRSLDKERVQQQYRLDVTDFDRSIPSGTRGTTTYNQQKQQFPYGLSNKYSFSQVNHSGYRVIVQHLAAHWTKGCERADFNVFLWHAFTPEFKKHFRTRFAEQLRESKHHENQHRLDGNYLNRAKVPSEEELSSMNAIDLLPLLYICLMPTQWQGKSPTSLITLTKELITDEIAHYKSHNSQYLGGLITYLGNYEIATSELFMALDEIEKAMLTMEWWVQRWFPVRPVGSNKMTFQIILDKALDDTSTGINLYGIYSLWQESQPAYRQPQHFSHILRTKRELMEAERTTVTPVSSLLMRLLSMPTRMRDPAMEGTSRPASEEAKQVKFVPRGPFSPPLDRAKPAAGWGAKPAGRNLHALHGVFEDMDMTAGDHEDEDLHEPDEQEDEVQAATPLASLNSTGANGMSGQRPTNDSKLRSSDLSGKACDKMVLRGACYANTAGSCPWDHKQSVVEAARKACIDEWKRSNKDSRGTIAHNLNVMQAAFNRPYTNTNLYDHLDQYVGAVRGNDDRDQASATPPSDTSGAESEVA
jgi:hypothetical protein